MVGASDCRRLWSLLPDLDISFTTAREVVQVIFDRGAHGTNGSAASLLRRRGLAMGWGLDGMVVTRDERHIVVPRPVPQQFDSQRRLRIKWTKVNSSR